MLLIGSGLVVRSFLQLAHTQLGFASDHLLTFQVNPVAFSLQRNYAPFFSDILNRIQHLPGVRSAALTEDIPMRETGFPDAAAIQVVGRPKLPMQQRPMINNSLVSLEFFHTLGIRLDRGRSFDVHDFVGVPPAGPRFLQREAVVVNEAFVRRIFPNEDPLDRQLIFGDEEMKSTWTIVGVVSDIRSTALGADPPPTIFRCTCSGVPMYRGGYLVRTFGDPASDIPAVEQQIRAVDRDQPISDVKTMDQRRDAALVPERFQLALLGSFAIIAILLAAAGVYGTMSYLVARRTREFGIRMAMGARPANILRMVLGETTLLVVLAIVFGLFGAYALTRYIRSMLYGVSALDPATFAVTSLLLAAIVFAASLGPAHRATSIDPMKALREE